MTNAVITEDFDDHRRPLQRALRYGVIALVVLTIVSLAVWGYLRAMPGVWGVLLGAGIGGGFVLLTALSVLATAKTTPATTGAVVLGGWLVKIVVLLIIMYFLRDMVFYDKVAFLVTIVLALIVVLACEVRGVLSTNTTYVQA